MKSYLLMLTFTFVVSAVLGQIHIVSMETSHRINHLMSLISPVSKNSNSIDKSVSIKMPVLNAVKSGLGNNQLFSLRTFADENYITFPQRVTTNFEKGINFFEFGMGGTYAPTSSFGRSFYSYPLLGIRIQPQNAKKFILRIFGSYPFSGNFIEGPCILPLGLSVGFVVK